MGKIGGLCLIYNSLDEFLTLLRDVMIPYRTFEGSVRIFTTTLAEIKTTYS